MDVGCVCSSRTAARTAGAEGESSEMRLDRSAVILDRHPLWLDAMSKVARRHRRRGRGTRDRRAARR